MGGALYIRCLRLWTLVLFAKVNGVCSKGTNIVVAMTECVQSGRPRIRFRRRRRAVGSLRQGARAHGPQCRRPRVDIQRALDGVSTSGSGNVTAPKVFS